MRRWTGALGLVLTPAPSAALAGDQDMWECPTHPGEPNRAPPSRPGRTPNSETPPLLTDSVRLRRSALLDTPGGETFDRLTRLASRLLRAPIALICLVDKDRHCLKSSHGL